MGEPRLVRCSNRPVFVSTEVTVKLGQERIKVCSMEEPSVEAKYFSSFVKNIEELTNIGPGPFSFMASALTFRRWSAFSESGTVKGSRTTGVVYFASGYFSTGTSEMRVRWMTLLALAIETARSAIRATSSLSILLDAAKPQEPSTSTRTPKP